MVDIVARSYLKWNSVLGGAVADKAERDKHNNYIDLKSQYIFTPLAFESFGAVGRATTSKLIQIDFVFQNVSNLFERGLSVLKIKEKQFFLHIVRCFIEVVK